MSCVEISPIFDQGTRHRQPHSDNSTFISLQNRRERKKKKGIKIWWVHNFFFFFFSIHLSLTDGRSLFRPLNSSVVTHTKSRIKWTICSSVWHPAFPFVSGYFFFSLFYFIIPFCKNTHHKSRPNFFQAKGGKCRAAKVIEAREGGVTFYKETVCVCDLTQERVPIHTFQWKRKE